MLLPARRGNVPLSTLKMLNTMMYLWEYGCNSRVLPKCSGNWHNSYTRMNRWVKSGVLGRVFSALQYQQIIRILVEEVSLDSTAVKLHPYGIEVLKKTGHKASVNLQPDRQPGFMGCHR